MDLFDFLTCLKDKRFKIVIKNVSIGGSKGAPRTRPSWSQLFQFHAVFGKNLAK